VDHTAGEGDERPSQKLILKLHWNFDTAQTPTDENLQGIFAWEGRQEKQPPFGPHPHFVRAGERAGQSSRAQQDHPMS
jgi:hypothetical protein